MLERKVSENALWVPATSYRYKIRVRIYSIIKFSLVTARRMRHASNLLQTMEDAAASYETARGWLREALGDKNADFRDGQWEAIDAVVNRRQRVLVVQRTGWGKSVVYFLSTRLLRQRGEGVTLIVSPLISLMRNQVEQAQRFGVRAATINSTNSDEWERHFEVQPSNERYNYYRCNRGNGFHDRGTTTETGFEVCDKTGVI
jgi:superfamily II DNA helicase RecQ